MDKYVELKSDIFLSSSDADWRVEYVAVKEGDYIKPGQHLGIIENSRGGGASLTSQYGGEIIKLFLREGDRFSGDVPMALIRINYNEFPQGWLFSNFYKGLIFGANEGRVFVVHGHDDAAREVVSEFLKELGLTPVVLNEQPNKGRTIIEKFEQHADVGFAVVILTQDDLGADNANAAVRHLMPRARQNVILELGYFIARLGRNRVCALKDGSIELPSDILGIGYVEYDAQGLWRAELAVELKAAGYRVDAHGAGESAGDA